jgi:divalent metal cation (Fe/Co/Zn/Cd) transporter
MTNSVGGLVALGLITMGFPSVVDKIIAMVISIVLVYKGAMLAHENMVEGSNDHDEEDLDNTEGIGFNPTLG